jgi:hypothetical protein
MVIKYFIIKSTFQNYTKKNSNIKQTTAQYLYTSTTIKYDGSGTMCESCTTGQLFDYYNCTTNTLLQSFIDPVPPGYIVTEIDVTLFGMFGCTTTAVIYMTVDTGVIGPSNSTCSCIKSKLIYTNRNYI